MKVSYNDLGKKGNLGNQLFQIGSLLGIADKNNCDYGFPTWKYEQYFKNKFRKLVVNDYSITEKAYHYNEIIIDRPTNIRGWLQSEKYWAHCKDKIKNQFTFNEGFLNSVLNKVKTDKNKKTIAISIRRGDFVGNSNYYQLPITYYVLSLVEHFPNYEDYNIIFFSDDVPYCKVNFECLSNAYFTDGLTDIEQLALMTTCDHFIISNSTFSWWGAYLGENEYSKVIRPFKNIDGKLARNSDEKDYWQPNWIVFEHEGKKIDLTRVTFTIPIFNDHPDRVQNMELSVCLLQRYCDTNIIIGEQGKSSLKYMSQYCKYHYFEGMVLFHRTKMLNEMCMMANTPYIANWDCDMVIPPMQLYITYKKLEEGVDMVYPYDGRFARVPRRDWFPLLEKYLDIGIVGDTQFKGKNGKPLPISSVGGAIFVNKEKFIESGMENEFMISFAPEDCERWDRWHCLGYKVQRVLGTIYHIDHFIGVNSSPKNPYWKPAHNLLDKIRAMSKEELRSFVDSWKWVKQYINNN